MEELLKIIDVKQVFGGLTALQGINITVNKGEIVGIIGPNGAGKTTLFNIITGFYKPTEGHVYLDGKEITGKHDYIITKYGIARTFQNPRLFKKLTVLDNIMIGRHTRRKENIFSSVFLPRTFRTNEKKQIDVIEDIMRLLEIEQFKYYLASGLSYGYQRRVEIARALATEPKLLLLDEPLGALDLKLRQDMQYELIRLKNELGITFIYVTHDQEEALTMSDTIVVMNQGYIQQIGTPESIYNEPENAFVADFIGDSNIIGATMIRDRLVEILGARFDCVDTGFGENKPVDVVIRPEDVELVSPEEGILQGTLIHSIFKGVHYEMEVMANGFEWLVQSTKMVPVGTKVGIKVDPFNIQIMKKPESEDEEAIGVNE